MKKTIIRIVCAVSIFVASVLLIELATGHTATGTAEVFGEPTLPVVTMTSGKEQFNELHGFVTERDMEEYRAVLTPLSSDRSLTFQIDPCGGSITSVQAEVRDVSGARLIERDELSPESTDDGGVLSYQASFGDLVTESEEYLLVIVVSTKDRQNIRYYTRISMAAAADDTYVSALDFVSTFHKSTLLADNEKYIETYIEPDASADNSTLAEVDINSSYDQVVWNSLLPEETVSPVFSILRAENSTFILEGTFAVRVSTGQEGEDAESHTLLCTEYYRIRQGSDRFHLLNYRRSATEIYDPSTAAFDENTVHLGIVQPSGVETVSSDDGTEVAFVMNGSLYVCRSGDSTAAEAFSFASADSTDRRALYAEHDIRILGMDEDDGSVQFLVYGYMNSGSHEGETGISLCTYRPDYRTVEETAFISFSGSFAVLQSEVETSAYLSSFGRLYLLLENTLYEINTQRGTARVLESWTSGESASSEGGELIAFQETSGGSATGNIVLEDLSDLSRNVIKAGEGESLIPIGFLGKDLIYGVARTSDASENSVGTWFTPMYAIRIVDRDLNVLMDYEKDGYLISEAVINDNQITLHRVQRQKSEDGTVLYTAAADDEIVGTAAQSSGSGIVQTSSSDSFETVTDLTVTGLSARDVRCVHPRLYSSGEVREIALTSDTGEESSVSRYYVYGLYGFDRCFTDASDAVRLADSETGIVTGRGGVTVYESTTAERCEIDGIGASDETMQVYRSSGSIAACLDAILRYESVSVSVPDLIADGKSSEEILSENLSNAQVLDLSGCTMEEVLYYSSAGIPVLAITNSGSDAVLIIGYGPEKVAVWDPASGGMQLISRSSAEELFSANGNRFLTYVHTGSTGE